MINHFFQIIPQIAAKYRYMINHFFQIIPQIAAKYRVHMKEKPKLDLSKLVLSPMPGNKRTSNDITAGNGSVLKVYMFICHPCQVSNN